jgi:hypothetical protein
MSPERSKDFQHNLIEILRFAQNDNEKN